MLVDAPLDRLAPFERVAFRAMDLVNRRATRGSRSLYGCAIVSVSWMTFGSRTA